MSQWKAYACLEQDNGLGTSEEALWPTILVLVSAQGIAACLVDSVNIGLYSWHGEEQRTKGSSSVLAPHWASISLSIKQEIWVDSL